MRTGHHISAWGARIEHKELRKTSPEAARRAVVEYSRSNGHNVSGAARVGVRVHRPFSRALNSFAASPVQGRALVQVATPQVRHNQ
jgi:hypothetical protein